MVETIKVCFTDHRKELEEEAEKAAKVDEDEIRSVTSKDFGIDDFVPMIAAPTAVRLCCRSLNS